MTSYPYLTVARELNVDYGVVLKFTDELDAIADRGAKFPEMEQYFAEPFEKILTAWRVERKRQLAVQTMEGAR